MPQGFMKNADKSTGATSAPSTQSTNENPSKVDTAASEACVRSGTFALLISVALLLLIPSWREQQNYDALRRYVTDRLALAGQVDRLGNDPFWGKYKASNAEAESISIADLLGATVVVSSTKAMSVRVPEISPPPRHRAKKAISATQPAPGAPTGLSAVATASVGLVEIKPIADTLGRLNDSDVLTRTRSVSNFFNVSLFRWLDTRNMWAYQNQILNKCFTGNLEVPNQVKTSDVFVPAIENEGLLKCLTLQNVRDLAKLELPTFQNPQLGDHLGPQVDVQPGTFLPHNLYWASVLAEVLLFVMMVHFSAFVLEAVSSLNFPAPGTIFSAFGRSGGTLFVFGFAICVPPITSSLILWASWASGSVGTRALLLLCMIAIYLPFVSILIALFRDHYFRYRWGK
jgi:hypothetical protein